MLGSFRHYFLVGFAAILGVAPLLAHHEISAKFDPAKSSTLNGLVTYVDWRNPHVHVLINAREGERQISWAIELESPLDLERSGWTRDSVKPGDAVTVQGILARDGSRQLWGNSVTLTSSRRKVLAVAPEAAAALKPAANSQPAKPTPRWPDGHPRLGPLPSETGYWARPNVTLLAENGVKVEANAN